MWELFCKSVMQEEPFVNTQLSSMNSDSVRNVLLLLFLWNVGSLSWLFNFNSDFFFL